MTNNISRRMGLHRTFAFRYKSPTAFHRAIRKYGWAEFEMQIIYRGEDARLLEEHFIREHNTLVPHGYNIQKGGSVGWVGKSRCMSEETKQKIGDANRGKQRTLEQNFAQSQRMKGVKRSPELGRKLSLARKGKSNWWCIGEKNPAAKICIITTPSGSQTIENLAIFCKHNNINYQTAASAAQDGRFIRKGYHFTYVGSILPKI